MKEVRLDSRLERMNGIYLHDAPGQGIALGRGDVSDGLLAISLCLTVLGPKISRNDSLANQRKRDGVYSRITSDR